MKELTPFPSTGLVLLGYSRISNQDKERELSIEIQNERLASEGVHRLYWDQQSGDDDDRPEYMKLLADCEELAIAGRKVEIVACRLDRLSGAIPSWSE